MIYTYRNLYLSLLLIIQRWYIDTKTFIIPCYNKMIIYTYRTFSSSIRVIMKWWYIHTETFFILSCFNEVMIYTYRNFSLFFLLIMKWWYIHTATYLYPSLLLWIDDIYIPQLFFILPCFYEVMIYTYRNLSLSFLVIMNWWYIHTATFLYLSLL